MTNAECRVVLVECCEGMRVRPAHGCKRIPVCTCGWIGDHHASKLSAEMEWLEDHRYPKEGIESRRRFQAQRLVNKLSALRDARLVAGGWCAPTQEALYSTESMTITNTWETAEPMPDVLDKLRALPVTSIEVIGEWQC